MPQVFVGSRSKRPPIKDLRNVGSYLLVVKLSCTPWRVYPFRPL